MELEFDANLRGIGVEITNSKNQKTNKYQIVIPKTQIQADMKYKTQNTKSEN